MRTLLLFLALPPLLVAAPKRTFQDELALRLDQLRFTVQNHEQELSIIQEQLETKEFVLETIQTQLANQSKLTEQKLTPFNHEIETLKTHANETTKTLTEMKKALESQHHRLGELQQTLQILVEAIQGKSTSTYTVKSGDSLEKIARHHNTTIQNLKELNNLTSDKIRVGQTLKVPEA